MPSSPLLPSSLLLATLLLLLSCAVPAAHAQQQPTLPPNIPTLTVSGNINFTVPPALTSAQIAAGIAALPYHTSTTSQSVRSALPRFYGPGGFPIADSTQRAEWIRGTVSYIVPGVVMAVLTLVAWLCVSVYMCCRKRRYGLPGYEEKRRDMVANAWLGFFTLLAIIFASVGLAYNHYVSSGLTGGSPASSITVSDTAIQFTSPPTGDASPGVTTAAKDVLLSLDVFFTAFPVLLTGLIHRVNAAVGAVNGNITDATSLVQSVQSLAVEASSIVSSVKAISADGFTCGSACQAAIAPLSDVSNQLNNVLLPVVEVIEYDIKSIDSQLIASESTITSALNSAIAQLATVNQTIASHETDVQPVIDDIEKYNHDREAATVVLLILPFICIPLLAWAYLRRSALAFKINMHWMFFVSAVCWVLFGVHLALTSAVSDACLYVDGVESDLPSHFNTQTTSVLQSCMLNTSLLSVVGIGNDLSFAFSIQIPDITSLEQLINVGEIDTLSSSFTQDALLSAIGYNATAIASAEQQSLAALNQLTSPDVYTLSTVAQCVPSKYGSHSQQVAQLQSTIAKLQLATATIPPLASAVQSNVSTLVSGVNSVETEANSIFASFSDVATTIAPVVNAGAGLVESAYCGVLGDDYFAAKHSFCWTVQRGVGMIALATFLIALLLVPAIYFSIRRAWYQDELDEAGKEGAVLSSPASPPSIHSPAYMHAVTPPSPSTPRRFGGPPGGHPTVPLASMPSYSSASFQPEGVPAPQHVDEHNYRYEGETESN